MTPYWIIVLILVIMSYIGCTRLEKNSLAYKSNKNHSIVISFEKTTVLLMFVLLWVLTAFRSSEIGNDTRNYIGVFESIYNFGPNLGIYMERGYQLFNYFIGHVIGNDPHMFLIICATIIYVPVVLYIYKHSENYYLSLCLFFCLLFSFYTNTIRQGLASVLGLIAYYEIKKGKKLIPIILIILASSFHYSAIVLFIFFFKKAMPKKYSTCLVIGAVLVAVSILGIPNRMIGVVAPRYLNYFQSDRVGSGYLALTYELIINVVFCWFAYFALKDGENSNGEDTQLIKTVFAGSLFITCLAFNMNLIARANNFFMLVAVIELPNMIRKKYKGKGYLIAWLVIIIMLAYFMVVQYLRPEWNHLYPYHFW